MKKKCVEVDAFGIIKAGTAQVPTPIEISRRRSRGILCKRPFPSTRLLEKQGREQDCVSIMVALARFSCNGDWGRQAAKLLLFDGLLWC